MRLLNDNGFRSKLEETIWKRAKKRIGRRKFPKLEYETETIPYVLVKKYKPDYVLRFRDGSIRYIEVKGYLRPGDRTKMAAVKKLNPDLDIRLVFAADNKLNKSSNTKYSDWAKKNGFMYAVGEIPPNWFKK